MEQATPECQLEYLVTQQSRAQHVAMLKASPFPPASILSFPPDFCHIAHRLTASTLFFSAFKRRMLPSRPFALNDKESLDDYRNRMSWFKTRATRILPLEEGLTFGLALAAPTDVGEVDALRPTIGRLQAMATYVLVKALQQGPRYQSQV